MGEKRSASSVAGCPVSWGQFMGDMSPEEFLEEYWEKRFAVSHFDEEFGRSLFTLEDFDRLMQSVDVKSNNFRAVKTEHEKTWHGNQEIRSRDDAFTAFAEGATLVLHNVQEQQPGLAKLCRTLSQVLWQPHAVNVYLTPIISKQGQQGLPVHIDGHDVFVFQLLGRKEWQVWDKATEYPTDDICEQPDPSSLGEPVKELTLEAGDLFYLPRGYPHRAQSAGDVPSLHLTVGTRSITWGTVLRRILDHGEHHEPNLRKCLPVGWAQERDKVKEQLSQIVEKLLFESEAPASALEFLHSRISSTSSTSLHGRIVDVGRLHELTDGSVLNLREEVACEMSVDTERVYLRLLGKQISFPVTTASALRRVFEMKSFTPESLSDSLDEESRITLVKTLIKQGLLTVVSTN